MTVKIEGRITAVSESPGRAVFVIGEHVGNSPPAISELVVDQKTAISICQKVMGRIFEGPSQDLGAGRSRAVLVEKFILSRLRGQKVQIKIG